PTEHGMVANGYWSRKLCRPLFWEQSSKLVEGDRIWEGFRGKNGRVGMMFWQQSLGEEIDLVLSPAPIHKHHGGMIQDCYCHPADLYKNLCNEIGEGFKLRNYWGPLANAKVGDWIASATQHVINNNEIAPELLFVYLPSLDYDLQRFGPKHAKSQEALEITLKQIDTIVAASRNRGYETIIFGDYAITETPNGAVFPNKILLEAGLFKARSVNGMLYPDLYASRAFAMVDHQIAHVYIKDISDIGTIKDALSETIGIEKVLDKEAQAEIGVAHCNGGELLIIADEGYWLAYPWWTEKAERPDYATHVDIHNKPGYDPCELFFGWPPFSVSQNTGKIKGSHGRAGAGCQTAWASTVDLSDEPTSLIELALGVKNWFNGA
ncbi:MAG: alkaline phosphatase family protein, partial [Planctomycetota bacterium]